MSASNADRFLTLFSEVEKYLRDNASLDRWTSFSELLSIASRKNKLVGRYHKDLKEFADLRNAIVHERTDHHVIAEPNDRAVRDFSHIRSMLLSPPKVIPKFLRDVLVKQAEDSVGSAVVAMRSASFSQVPIVSREKIIAVLTPDAVSRWLAHELSNDLVSLLDTSIAEVLPHTEDPEHYAVVSHKASLVEVLDIFEDFASRGRALNAVLVSPTGRPQLPLVGILTVYDLPAVLSELKVNRVSAT
jgi:predicted transcriptional regulator